MNKIIFSCFTSTGIRTGIENPTPLVLELMRGISVEEPETHFGCPIWYFHHHDIGTKEKMNSIFESLDRTARTLRELEKTI